MGFVPYGVEPQTLKAGGRYADMETMSLALREPS